MTVHINPPVGPFSVSAPVYCSLTRFGFSSRRHMLATRRQFAEVERAAEHSKLSGLLKSAFLIENSRAAFSLSLWDREPQISAFVNAHVHAANNVFGRLVQDPDAGPELWSTQWRLDSVSNNLRWHGLDLSRFVGEPVVVNSPPWKSV